MATPTPTLSATATSTLTPTATPTVTPVPQKLSIRPKKLNFKKVAVNTTSKPKHVAIKNPHKRTSVGVIVQMESSSNPDYSIANQCEKMLAPGPSGTATITFRPTHTGTAPATLMIFDNATGAPQAVPLAGTGT
jgi:hypothetical protein